MSEPADGDPAAPRGWGALQPLADAVAAGRLHHAWIWAGGGRRAADLAAAATRALLCDASAARLSEPCGACPACRAARGGDHPDRLVPAADDRGRVGVREVRDLVARVRLSRQVAHRRIAWLPAADRLSPAAQSALLKCLEEPPEGTLFFLAAGRPGALLATVRSRCRLLALGTAAGGPPDVAALADALAGADGEAHARLSAVPAERLAREVEALLDVADVDGAAPAWAAWPAILARAAEWGRDADLTTLAGALVEASVARRLAARLRAAPAGAAPAAVLRLAAAAAALSDARRGASPEAQRAYHLARVLAPLAGGSP